MRLKALALAVTLAAGAALAPQIAAAASLPGATAKSLQTQAGQSSLVEEVRRHRRGWRGRHYDRPRHYGGRCFRIRNYCADRHGVGRGSFYRCLNNLGCGW